MEIRNMVRWVVLHFVPNIKPGLCLEKAYANQQFWMPCSNCETWRCIVMILATISWYSVGPIFSPNRRITASDYMDYICSDNRLSTPVKSTVLPFPQNKKCRCVELIIYLCSECFQLSLRFPHSLMAWYLFRYAIFIIITGLQHNYVSYCTWFDLLWHKYK
jgi:hypothetical protein